VTKILYYRFLLLDQFRFGETHFTTYQRSWPITMRIVHSWAVNNENGFFCGKLPLKIKNLTGLCHKERTSFLYWRIFAACACGWISCDIMRYHAISCDIMRYPVIRLVFNNSLVRDVALPFARARSLSMPVWSCMQHLQMCHRCSHLLSEMWWGSDKHPILTFATCTGPECVVRMLSVMCP